MHWTLQLAGSFVLIGIAVAMILFEQARLRTNPPFPVTEGGRVFSMDDLSFADRVRRRLRARRLDPVRQKDEGLAG